MILKYGEWVVRVLVVIAILSFCAIGWMWHCHGIENAQFLAYLIGSGFLIVPLYVANRRAVAAEDTAKATHRTAASTEKGNIAERFKVAIEHLGNTSESVRLGGIYALHHLAQEEENYSERIFQILCAHVRGTTSQKGYKPVSYKLDPTGVEPILEIQIIFSLLFKKELNEKIYENYEANLDDADLEGIILMDMNLTKAQMCGANLKKMKIYRSNLRKTVFTNSDLCGAYFIDTNLEKVDLVDAEMKRILVKESNLKGTKFGSADMRGVTFKNNKNLTVEQLENVLTFDQAKFVGQLEEKIKEKLKIKYPDIFKKP